MSNKEISSLQQYRSLTQIIAERQALVPRVGTGQVCVVLPQETPIPVSVYEETVNTAEKIKRVRQKIGALVERLTNKLEALKPMAESIIKKEAALTQLTLLA